MKSKKPIPKKAITKSTPPIKKPAVKVEAKVEEPTVTTTDTGGGDVEEIVEDKPKAIDLFVRKEKWGVVVMTEQASMAGDESKKKHAKTNIINGRLTDCIHRPKDD